MTVEIEWVANGKRTYKYDATVGASLQLMIGLVLDYKAIGYGFESRKGLKVNINSLPLL